MTIENAVMFFVGVLIILISALLVLVVIPRLRKGASPQSNLVLDALSKYVYTAIFAGQTLAITAEREFDTWLSGQDKKQVADAIYNLLPAVLMVGGKAVPVGVIKSLVPQTIFEGLVGQVYDEAHAFVLANEQYLIGQIDVLKPVGTANTSLQSYTGGQLTEAPLPSAIKSAVSTTLQASAGLNASNGTA